MNVRVNRTDLVGALTRARAGRPQGKRYPLPITKNVLLSARKGRLHLCGTDLEVVVLTDIAATITAGGEIAVDPDNLLKLARQITETDLQLVVKDREVRVIAGPVSAKFDGWKADEFPPIPVIKGKPFTCTNLAEALEEAAYAMAKDDYGRPVLHGFMMDAKGRRLMTGDGFRMVITPLKVRGDWRDSAVLPYRVASLIDELMGAAKAEITMRKTKPAPPQPKPADLVGFSVTAPVTSSSIYVSHPAAPLPPRKPWVDLVKLESTGVTILARAIDRTFIDYPQMIPKRGKSFRFARADMLRAVATVEQKDKDGGGIVRLFTKRGKTTVSTKRVGSEITVAFSGTGKVKVAYNSTYLKEMLDRCDDDRLTLYWNTTRPGMMLHRKSIHILMPTGVAWEDDKHVPPTHKSEPPATPATTDSVPACV